MRHELVAAREADGRGLGDVLARREQRVDACQQPLALRAARRIAEPLGREERRDRERRRVPEREIGEARQPRLEAVDDVEAARGPARARGSRAPRPARPSGCGGRSRTAGPMAISSGSSSKEPSSARRPAARSRARLDGARTVTEWPRRRSSRASPSTCSFTSCGCDQANGVTSAIRTRSSLVPV